MCHNYASVKRQNWLKNTPREITCQYSNVMSSPLTKKTDVPFEVWLFHITHIDNLASIIEQGGLLSFNELSKRSIKGRSIAFQHLQDRRDEIEVPMGAKGLLHDYVPLGFAARPPMLFTVWRGGLSEQVRQDDILHLCTTVGRVANTTSGCVWSDGHPLSNFSRFDDDLEMLPASLPWDALLSEQWHNTQDDPDRKRRRQAEFLVPQVVPWQIIRTIGVRTAKTVDSVQGLLANLPHQPKVVLVPEWYYGS
ncbi:MAG: DUF4433 domain-containing protein [Pedobacter sp.]|nr:MAG: DUF4433 domain-containing protein [Pedobacter sp.]